MPYGNNIYRLPSLLSYEAVKNWFNKTSRPTRMQWRECDRPLDDARKYHYRITKEDNEYKVCLYDTAVVTWKSETEFVLDATNTSVTTNDFIYRMSPVGYPQSFFHKIKRRTYSCFKFDGVLFLRDRNFYFKKNEQTNEWVLINGDEHKKPTKPRLRQPYAREVMACYKDAFLWSRAMWAVCGDDGSHPFVGVPCSDLPAIKKNIFDITLDNDEKVQAFIKCFIPHGFNLVYKKCDIKWLHKQMRAAIYRYYDCYEEVPYDA